MKLSLKTNHKSLIPFEIDLKSDLTVITGVNGSGKTHILKGIQDGTIQIFDGEQQIPNSKIKYAEYSSLTPQQATTVTNDVNNKIIEQIFPSYNGFQNAFKTNPNISLLQCLSHNSNHERVVRKIALTADKPISDLTKTDFYTYFPIDAEPNMDILYHSFSLIIKRYWDKYIENQTRQWMATKGYKQPYFADSVFRQKYGEEPWNLINTILRKALLDCQIDAPDYAQRDIPYELKLSHTRTNAKINFNDLSGGEKVLMSLAIMMYNANLERDFPKVILLDEGDATLNPSMSQHYLDILSDIFIRQKKVKVILTTHSLSTVAFAPEESLYVMDKAPANPRLVKTTKEEAIKKLSYGVKSFSINYDMRRQVFVESKHDVTFYTKMYLSLKNHLDKDVPLHFLASGEGDKNADCEEVKRFVRQLSKAGNSTVFGLIDWDGKHNETSVDKIKVIGKNNRYSIENYVFDPLFLAVFLQREGFFDKTELGFIEEEDYRDIRTMNSSKIQVIVDKITQIVKIKNNLENLNEQKISVTCVNGARYFIPTWYLHMQGHTLEALIKKTFSQLNRYNNAGNFALKSELLNKVIGENPNLISKDFLDVFREIQQ